MAAEIEVHGQDDDGIDAAWEAEQSAKDQQKPLAKTNGHHPPAETTIADWATFGYDASAKGAIMMNLNNALIALENDPIIKGHIWYDEFLDRILTDWNGETRNWKDVDDVLLCVYLQRHCGLKRISVTQAHDAAKTAAFHNKRNECKDWLESLTWDGTPRLEYMLSDGFGTPHDAYTQAVGRCWMVSIVARVMQPGCKVDTVPVLEGPQGIGKSTAMEILGGKWFTESHEPVTSKDFYGVLDGHMLVEISEMGSFTKAEAERIKGVISCQVDRYRKAYGRNTEDHPRHTVLVCTTNKDDWQKDETGARRFWPVRCKIIDREWLKSNRDNLFAEAVYRYKAGEIWHDVPVAEQEYEVDSRREVDSWEAKVVEFCASRDSVTLDQILTDCLNIEFLDQDTMTQRRVTRILRVTAWEPKVERDAVTKKPVRAWRRKNQPAVTPIVTPKS